MQGWNILSNCICQQGLINNLLSRVLIYWYIICQQGLMVEMLSNRIDQQGLIYWCIICQQGLICWAIVSISKGWGSKKSGILSPLNWSKPPGKKYLHIYITKSSPSNIVRLQREYWVPKKVTFWYKRRSSSKSTQK